MSIQSARRLAKSPLLLPLSVAMGALVGGVTAIGPTPAYLAGGFAAALLAAAVVLRKPKWLSLEVPVLLLLAATLSFRSRTAQDLADAPLDALAVFRLMCNTLALGLGLLALLSADRPLERGPLTTRPVRLYGFYASVAALGVATSVQPLITGYRVMELVAVIVVLAGAYRSRGKTSLVRIESMVYWYMVSLVTSVWLGFLFFPSRAMTPMNSPLPFRLNGVYPWVSSNTFGTLGVLLALWSIARLVGPQSHGLSKGALKIVAAFGLVSLILAQYRTGYVAFIVGLLLLLVIGRKKLLAGFLVALVAGLALSFPSSVGSTIPYLLRGADVDRAAQLSGRITWWKLGVDVWRQKPLVGGGLQTASRFEALAANDFDVSNIHSAWIEALVGTGIIGVLLLGASFVMSLRRAGKEALRAGGRLVPLLILTVMAVRSLTGGGFEQGGDIALLYLTLAWGLTDRQVPSKAGPIRESSIPEVVPA